MSIYARRQPRSVHLAGVFNFPGLQVALDCTPWPLELAVRDLKIGNLQRPPAASCGSAATAPCRCFSQPDIERFYIDAA